MKKIFTVAIVFFAVQSFAWTPVQSELEVVSKNFCSSIVNFYEYDNNATCSGKLFFVDPAQEAFLPKGTIYRIMSSAVQIGTSETVYDCAAWVRDDFSVEISDCDVQY